MTRSLCLIATLHGCIWVSWYGAHEAATAAHAHEESAFCFFALLNPLEDCPTSLLVGYTGRCTTTQGVAVKFHYEIAYRGCARGSGCELRCIQAFQVYAAIRLHDGCMRLGAHVHSVRQLAKQHVAQPHVLRSRESTAVLLLLLVRRNSRIFHYRFLCGHPMRGLETRCWRCWQPLLYVRSRFELNSAIASHT